MGNFDPSITDSSFRLKKNYERYLLEYEYKCFPDHRQQALELEKQMQLKKSQQQQPIFQAQQPLETLAPASPTSAYTASPLGTPKQARKQQDKSFGKKPASPTASPVSPSNSKRKSAPFGVSVSAMPKFPLVLGELCIESIGTIIARPPYITEKHVWPVGFSSTRYFSSMINPEIRVKYTSQIVDAGDKPQFIVTAADDLLNPIVSHSPSGAWRTVLKRVMNKSGTNDDRSKNVSVSGTLRFGLAHPVVASLLRELPGAEKSREFMLTNQTASNNVAANNANKKRKNETSSSDDSSSSDEFAAEWLSGSKSPRYDQPSSPSLSADEEYKDVITEEPDIAMSQEEAEDLESAVSVLQALKYCGKFRVSFVSTCRIFTNPLFFVFSCVLRLNGTAGTYGFYFLLFCSCEFQVLGSLWLSLFFRLCVSVLVYHTFFALVPPQHLATHLPYFICSSELSGALIWMAHGQLVNLNIPAFSIFYRLYCGTVTTLISFLQFCNLDALPQF